MLPVSENQVLPLAEGLGFTVVRFEDGDIRIDPPTPFLLVTLKQNGGPGPTPVDMTAFDGRRFYVVGRGPCCPLLNDTNRGLSVQPPCTIGESRCFVLTTTSELFSLIDEWRPLRVCDKNDFYAFPETGTFLLYASHHEEICLYSGWLTINETG